MNLCFIRIIWCDSAGIRRCRVVTCKKGLRDNYDTQGIVDEHKHGLGVTRACMVIPSWGDVVITGIGDNRGSVVGEVRLILDCNAVYYPMWSPNEVFVLGSFLNPDRSDWSCCPRATLQRIINVGLERGFHFSVGFETEFVLFHLNTTEPVDDTLYCSTYAFDRVFDYLKEVTEALSAMSIHVEQIHAESSPGQFELVTRHADPMTAADQLIITRETLSSIASKYNTRVSFTPKFQAMVAGNGQHCHISIWKDGHNLFERCQVPIDLYCPKIISTAATSLPRITNDNSWIDPIVNSFLAGILHRIDTLALFTAGSPNSKRRLQPGCWAGAFKCWGVNNKEAPLRIPTTWTDHPITNVEYKLFDATANPHVGLAVILAAGLEGIVHQETLPPATTIDPGALSQEDLLSRGIERVDARSFRQRVLDSVSTGTATATATSTSSSEDSDEGSDKLEEKGVQRIVDELGGLVSFDMLASVLAVKNSEFEYFKDATLEEEVKTILFRY